jgi:hypothetical protein
VVLSCTRLTIVRLLQGNINIDDLGIRQVLLSNELRGLIADGRHTMLGINFVFEEMTASRRQTLFLLFLIEVRKRVVIKRIFSVIVLVPRIIRDSAMIIWQGLRVTTGTILFTGLRRRRIFPNTERIAQLDV